MVLETEREWRDQGCVKRGNVSVLNLLWFADLL